ncbi:MAG: hypothetical protein PHN80_15715 [Hespellia sp.]|nr:hypothetical protein [Hespellia sp.]
MNKRKELYGVLARILIPMLIVATANLWHGAVMRFAPLDTVWYIIAMLCIGFIEEILCRGKRWMRKQVKNGKKIQAN